MNPVPPPKAPLATVARAFGLGAVRAARPLPFGVLNRNWRIATDRGDFALKAIDAHDPEEVRRRLALLPRLAEAGVPVVQAVAAQDGNLVPRIEGRAYCLTPWVEGEHPRGEQMTAGRSRHMGTVIGRIHTALADPLLGLPAAPRPSVSISSMDESRAVLARRLGMIEAMPASGHEFDRAAVDSLRRRLDLLDAHGHRRPDAAGTHGPFGWTHGDSQNWNLLWRGDRIVAVLDWDRLRPNAYSEEIARAAMYQFARDDGSVDLDDVAALIAGYRTERPIGTDTLVEAARHRWWRMATSDWHLEFHYDRGVHAADPFFFSDERLLRWWTAHYDAVEAAFV